MGAELDARVAARRQAELVAGLRRRARKPAAQTNGTGPPAEVCDLCGKELDHDHRHLLHLVDRSILCTCESCLALRGGDPELRPTGTRVAWLEDFELPEEIWAQFEIPIGLAFFLDSSASGAVVAMYPSPAGATESGLPAEAWRELRKLNPALATLEPDAEALIVNRMNEPARFVIVPIDECYRLVGMIKLSWEGISGGDGPERAIASFFDELMGRGRE